MHSGHIYVEHTQHTICKSFKMSFGHHSNFNHKRKIIKSKIAHSKPDIKHTFDFACKRKQTHREIHTAILHLSFQPVWLNFIITQMHMRRIYVINYFGCPQIYFNTYYITQFNSIFSKDRVKCVFLVYFIEIFSIFFYIFEIFWIDYDHMI